MKTENSNLIILKKVKLTEKDKKMILEYVNICTDMHGNNCLLSVAAGKN